MFYPPFSAIGNKQIVHKFSASPIVKSSPDKASEQLSCRVNQFPENNLRSI